ncbi:hypothetical protein N7520_005097 [Penicillium odoratum]|uniref:uncharacterized protein n=1 Tax=Penicillium odoratum TaxID=1167516 RepID=UPI0025489A1B|nr:uncharacterized protein N7520_005097 [Penicillium odoratum]KAJ5765538.1 hypothetical protein N7520_005097 [Penicillium odoratum]
MKGVPCKLCLIHLLATNYWGIDNRGDLNQDFKNLKDLIHATWKPETQGQQDVAEYWPEFHRQMKDQTMSMLQKDLVDLFRLRTVIRRSCQGRHACEGEWIPNEHDMMHLPFPDPEDDGKGPKSRLADAISDYLFSEKQVPTKCDTCHNDRIDAEYFTQPPECLIVHLNRIKMDKKGAPCKVTDAIEMLPYFELSASCLDPRSNVDKDYRVQYELVSVIMHHGTTPVEGHYYIFAKGPGNKWANFDDLQVTRSDKFDDWSKMALNKRRAYIFGYRRIDVKPGTEKITYRETSSTDERVGAIEIERINEGTQTKGIEEVKKGHHSTMKLKFTSADGPMAMEASVTTSEPMAGIEFPEKQGLLELTWVDDDENIIKDLNIQGVLKNVVGRKAKKKAAKASKFKEEFDIEKPKSTKSTNSAEAVKSVKSDRSGSGSNKSTKSKKSLPKPAKGSKPIGIEKKRGLKGALDAAKGMLSPKRVLGRQRDDGKGEKMEKEKEKAKRKVEKKTKK